MFSGPSNIAFDLQPKVSKLMRNILKPSLPASYQQQIDEVSKNYLEATPANIGATIDFPDGKLHMDRNKVEKSGLNYFHLTTDKSSLPITNGKQRKAIVYICGNGEYVGGSADNLYDLQMQLEQINPDLATHVYVQDYRGRGTNVIEVPAKEVSKYYKEHGMEDNRRTMLAMSTNMTPSFSDYPLKTDAIDQAALIKHLIENEHYDLDDILIIGHSLGGNVALWAKDILTHENSKYNDLNVFCSRTFGDILDYPGLGALFLKSTREQIHGVFRNESMEPEKRTWQIAAESPNCIIYQSQNDGVIPTKIDLATKLLEKSPDMKDSGRIHIGRYSGNELGTTTTHNASFKELSCGSKDTPLARLIVAQLTSTPVQINVNSDLKKMVDDYEVARRREMLQEKESKRSFLGMSFFGYTAEAKVQAASNLSEMLNRCDYEAIIKLEGKKSAYTTGEFNDIFQLALSYAKEQVGLQNFNERYILMKYQAKAEAAQHTASPSPDGGS